MAKSQPISAHEVRGAVSTMTARERAPELLTALRNLVRVADAYSDEMRKIGRGHMELGSEASSYSVSGEAKALIWEITGEEV